MAQPIAPTSVPCQITAPHRFSCNRGTRSPRKQEAARAWSWPARRARAAAPKRPATSGARTAADTSANTRPQRCKSAAARKNRRNTTGLLRHVHRRPAGGAHRDDAARRRRAQDGRELPLPLHGREGCRGRVPLFSNSVAQWIAYQTSNLGVAGSSPVGVVSPIARRPFSIRGRVGLSSMMNQEGVGFKPQSLRRRGFEPHRMHT